MRTAIATKVRMPQNHPDVGQPWRLSRNEPGPNEPRSPTYMMQKTNNQPAAKIQAAFEDMNRERKVSKTMGAAANAKSPANCNVSATRMKCKLASCPYRTQTNRWWRSIQGYAPVRTTKATTPRIFNKRFFTGDNSMALPLPHRRRVVAFLRDDGQARPVHAHFNLTIRGIRRR
jgi:hypothetical protein